MLKYKEYSKSTLNQEEMIMNRYEVKELFLNEINQLQGTILEVGFGNPLFYEKFSKSAKIFGADFSNDLVIKTKKLLKELNQNNRVIVLCSTDDNLPYENNSFDFIILSFCFCCLRKPRLMIKEIFRVAKNGGIIISFDHIRSNGIVGLFLHLSTPIYALMHKNCHLNRNPKDYYEDQGISILSEFKSFESFIPWLMTKCLINK